MTATGNEAVSLAQLKDYAANQSAGGGESACQVFTITSGSSVKRVNINGWEVVIPSGGGGTYVFLASQTFIVLHAMRFTSAIRGGNLSITRNSAQNLLCSVAYNNSTVTTPRGWPISGAPTRYTEDSNVTSDMLEVTKPTRNSITINIVKANDLGGYQPNINFKVNFCVWLA